MEKSKRHPFLNKKEKQYRSVYKIKKFETHMNNIQCLYPGKPLQTDKHSAFFPFTIVLCFTAGNLKFRLPSKKKSCAAEMLDWHVCTDLQLRDQTRVCPVFIDFNSDIKVRRSSVSTICN